MATITANGSKGHHKFTLEVNESSYSVNNNTSDVTYTLKIAPIQKGWDWNASGVRYSITINGTTAASGSISSYNGSSTVTIKSDTVTGIAHNNDGTKSMAYGFEITDSTSYSFTPGNASASGTLTLTTIPRASSIGVADANIGSSTNITINKNSSSFTTTIYYKASGQSSWTQIVSKTANQVYAWTVPTSFYALIPNSKKITCQFYADTYNGSTLVGTSSTVTATFTATGNPTISSFTLVDTNSTTTNLTGDSSKMVRYASNVKATVSASGQNSASVSSITVNGTTASSGVVNFNGATTNSYQAVVTDSRGYTTSQTKTMTMVNYVNLTLNATVTRNQPTDGNVNIAISGNYFNGSFGSQSNTLTTQYRYKERTSSSWGSWTSITPTISGNTYNKTTQLSGFDYTKVYDFQIRAIDKVQTKSVTGITVSKGVPIFNWDGDEFDVNTTTNLKNGVVITGNTKFGTTREDSASTGWTYNEYGSMQIKDGATGNSWAMKDSNGNIVVRVYPNSASGTPARFLLNMPSITISEGGGITTDPTNSFQTTIFGSNNSSYRIKPFRNGGSALGPFQGIYSPSFAVSTGDTHFMISCSYTSGACKISAGNADKLNWTKAVAWQDELPSVTTGTGSSTKSSGNGTMTAVQYSKYGNVVTLTLTFNNSGSATSAGGNIWVGTISGVSLPKTYGAGCGYYSSSGYMAELDSSGNLTIRVIGGQSASNSTARRVTMTYVCA